MGEDGRAIALDMLVDRKSWLLSVFVIFFVVKERV
jgi:hypothetical protein